MQENPKIQKVMSLIPEMFQSSYLEDFTLSQLETALHEFNSPIIKRFNEEARKSNEHGKGIHRKHQRSTVTDSRSTVLEEGNGNRGNSSPQVDEQEWGLLRNCFEGTSQSKRKDGKQSQRRFAEGFPDGVTVVASKRTGRSEVRGQADAEVGRRSRFSKRKDDRVQDRRGTVTNKNGRANNSPVSKKSKAKGKK